jgi:hypothetical protein
MKKETVSIVLPPSLVDEDDSDVPSSPDSRGSRLGREQSKKSVSSGLKFKKKTSANTSKSRVDRDRDKIDSKDKDKSKGEDKENKVAKPEETKEENVADQYHTMGLNDKAIVQDLLASGKILGLWKSDEVVLKLDKSLQNLSADTAKTQVGDSFLIFFEIRIQLFLPLKGCVETPFSSQTSFPFSLLSFFRQKKH